MEGRSDIVVLGIHFEGEPPMSYKLMINGYLTGQRRTAGERPPAPQGLDRGQRAPSGGETP